MEKESVDKYVEGITKILSELDPETRMFVLQKVMYQEAENEKMNPAKLANGTMGESILCKALGITWNNKTIHGHDATNSKGEPCEIKTALYKLAPKTMININYKLPERKKNESGKVYLKRITKNHDAITGGHYWAARKGTDLIYHWHIDGKNMSEFLAVRVADTLEKIPTNKTFVYNFGGKVCANCRKIHRIENIVNKVNCKDYAAALKPVSRNC